MRSWRIREPRGAELASSSSRIHFLTAVTRPENLSRIAESLQTAIRNADADVTWHLRFDVRSEHIGGQGLKNKMLEEIEEGWIYILDDDTHVHPDLFASIREGPDAIIVSQRRHDGYVLEASPLNAHVGMIDMGQAILRRSFIGEA